MTLPGPPFQLSFSVSSNLKFIISVATTVILISSFEPCSGTSHGKLIGKLSQFHHGVSGEVYAIDGRTLYIKDLTYDGEGPAAYFYAGNSKEPIVNGFRVRDERGTYDLLRKYRKENIILTLPEGKTLNNIRWFALWCDDFSVNFGDVRIPRGFDYPKPQKLGSLKGIHGVSSEPVVVVDAQTFLIPSFSYDGEAPDAKFWVGSGSNPTPQGVKIPDENGKVTPLRKYDHKTIVLTLPGDLTIHQLGHFGVWCEAFTVDFGHVKISKNLNVPPSLKMLGVSPQSKLNCEVLQDDLAFEVRWAVAGDSVVIQLVAKLDGNQYMSFGVSNDRKKSVMVGGDVVVSWVDKQTLQGYAVDYFLDAKSQCSGQRGSCPDVRIQDNTNSVRLLNAAMVNGYSIVTYQRPLKATDELDVPITTNGSQAIIWAIGPLNERKEVSFHSDYLKNDQLIEFGRAPRWNCPMPDSQGDNQAEKNDQGSHESAASNAQESAAVTTRRPQRVPPPPAPASKNGAWQIPPIQCNEPEDGVFYAQMGPTGGTHGYPAITGHVGWGISWYINGLLIPEINVVRGKKYNFVVEGGSDPGTPARYHPFYITDDPIGGYQHKTPEEKAGVKIFAGVERIRGKTRPTGVGRHCNWIHDQSKPDADDYKSFGGFQRTLTLECDHGEPGIVEWTPDENTPDTVYYQCYTHRHLGWKINVLDECDETVGSSSEVREIYAEFQGARNPEDDLEGAGSVGVSSKVTPGPDFYENHREYIRNPSSLQAFSNNNNNNNNNNDNRGKGSQSIRQVNNPIYDSYERLKSFESSESSENNENKSRPQSTSSSSNHDNNNNDNNNSAKTDDDDDISQEKLNNDDENIEENSQFEKKQIHDTRNRGNPSGIINHNGFRFGYGMQGPPSGFRHPSMKNVEQPQLMIIRRPVVNINRRPLQSSIIPLTIISNPLSMIQQRQQQQFFIERKKPIYRNPSSSSSSLSSSSASSNNHQQHQQHHHHHHHHNHHHPHNNHYQSLAKRISPQIQTITKLTKNDFNQNTIESKMSMVPNENAAKNTGFKPESVVVEGGFKPIIRITDVTEYAEDRRFRTNDEDSLSTIKENSSSEYRPFDNFEPMFVPSPPDRNQSKKLKKKIHSQIQRNFNKPRISNEDLGNIDDDIMETAADGIDASYLPPASGVLLNNNNKAVGSQQPSSSSSSASGTLVTADGTKLLDDNLARSIIPRVNERMRSRLSADVLSRTPQFGQFRGELPPAIPGNVQTDSIPQLNHNNNNNNNNNHNQQQQFSTGSLSSYPNSGVVRSSGNTRLTLVKRTKRSPHHVPGHNGDDDDDDDVDVGKNMTSSVVTNAQVTATNEEANNNNNNHDINQHSNNVHDHEHDHHSDTDHHHHHHHHDHDHDHDHDHSTVPSAGEFVMANIEYILLTVVLYFVI